MSRKLVTKENYKGLTVNERLLVSGKLDKFDHAIRQGNRRKMISMLEGLALTKKYATDWVDTLLGDQKSFYF